MKNKQLIKMLAMEAVCKLEILHDLANDNAGIRSNIVRALIIIERINDIIKESE